MYLKHSVNSAQSFLDNSLYRSVEFQRQKTQVCSALKCNENGSIHLEILMLPLLDVTGG